MYIYVKYYRMVCERPNQIKILDDVEGNAATRRFPNDSGKLITKHKVTLGQFAVLSVGLTKF